MTNSTKMLTALCELWDAVWYEMKDGFDINSGELQDLAEDLGLIRQVPYSPETYGDIDYDPAPGDPIFELSDMGSAAIALGCAARRAKLHD